MRLDPQAADEGRPAHPSFDEHFEPAAGIVDHDPTWAQQAQRELRHMAAALGPVKTSLGHVGSTAVPGLPARPILDLQLAIDAIEPSDRYRDPLEQLGYAEVRADDLPDYRLFAKPGEHPRACHLHVCVVNSVHAVRHLVLRTFLRWQAGEAEQYALVKRQLMAGDPHDRAAYRAGKEACLAELEGRAFAWARAQ